MTFTAPWWLLGLLVVAALAVAYVWLLRRRRRDVVRFTNLELLESVAPKRPGRWRHLPAIALIAALAVLTVALAGPQAMAKVPRNRATVMLVIDVSLSMKATDVAPTRLAAAQAAAKQFADQLTPGVNLGLVSFAGTAAVLVSPTTDRSAVKNGVDNLQLAESTATGEAIFTAMQSIDTFSRSLQGGPDAAGVPPPARIVLLSDGTQTVPGPDGENESRGSFTAAAEAKNRGIPVSTISFGTSYGTIELDGGRTPVPVDDASMERIAQLAGGRFFTAATESELRAVYSDLSEELGYEEREVDASRPWMIGGFVLLIGGLGAGILLGRRLP